MSRISDLKKKLKEYQELYYSHREQMNTAKTRMDFTKNQLERAEAKIICDYCKKPINTDEPYISVGPYNYDSKDCKSGGDLNEIESLQALENTRQNGKKSF